MTGNSETLCKLYLELSHVVPSETFTARELSLKKTVDKFGLALRMIEHGCADPAKFAAKTLKEQA